VVDDERQTGRRTGDRHLEHPAGGQFN
jgi:hypothetical protein